MNLSEIEGGIVDHRIKGMPGGMAPMPLSAIAAKGWNILAEDLTLPVCVINQNALEHNSRLMKAFLAATGAVIAPHGKTTMSPQLFRRQMEDGAWAITVGTPHQLQVARHFGFDRVVLANQLVGKQAIRYVLDELAAHPEFEFFCLVDSPLQVEAIARAARERKPGRPLQVFLEGGIMGGRTGVRTLDEARAVGAAIKAAHPHVTLRGVEGFEGLLHGEDADRRVRQFIDFLIEIARLCEAERFYGPGQPILTAGGSSYYDIVIDKFSRAGLKQKHMILTRSGCYLTHDSGSYRANFAAIRERAKIYAQLGEGPREAMEVWTYVQSRPEQTRALVLMGKRDATPDGQLPVPLKWHRPGSSARTPQRFGAGYTISAMNDQHGYLDMPADSPLQVGDLVGFGISHPCLTFDKWQVILLVDDSYDVIGAIRTFF
jgi:D-serine dehydratase